MQFFPRIELIPTVVRIPAGVDHVSFDSFPISATAKGGNLTGHFL